MNRSPVPVDILACGAHPDDVELGCGGSLAAFAARGKSFGILDLTRGEMGTRGTPEIREREAEEAARTLGAAFRVTLDLGDGGLRTDRDAELRIVEVVRRARPRLLIAPYPDDRHPDHARAGRLLKEASFYAGLRALETGVPAHRPQQVVFYFATYVGSPSFLVDVSGVLERKLAALAAYRSQFHDPSSKEPETFISRKGFVEAITARARFFGAMANVEHAEGFVSPFPPRVDDPVAAFEGYEPGF
jgi:bacillithiol biosynthesis deacetylase BshB1